MNRGADRRAREHLVQDDPYQAKQWIKQVAESTVFREYTGDASTIDDGEIGMPIAVLPSVDKFRERSPALRDGSESVARMLDQIRGVSPVLVLKPSIVDKQIRSRRKDKEKFHWTEYQKIQAIVEDARIVAIYPVKRGIRSVGWAKHGDRRYALVWDAESEDESGRNVLVSFYQIYDFEKWLAECERKERARRESRGE